MHTQLLLPNITLAGVFIYLYLPMTKALVANSFFSLSLFFSFAQELCCAVMKNYAYWSNLVDKIGAMN